MSGGNGDGSDLVQAHHADPELPAALEGEHDAVAFLQAVFGEHVGGFVAQGLQFSKGDDLLLPMIIAPDLKHAFEDFLQHRHPLYHKQN